MSVFNENHSVGERKNSLFGPTVNGIVTLADLNNLACIDDEISRIRKSSANMMTEKQKTEILIRENKSQKRATAIVTSGALTFLVVAATMVTASFLMSIIFCGRISSLLHRGSRPSSDAFNPCSKGERMSR